jgi:hypothetical protein
MRPQVKTMLMVEEVFNYISSNAELKRKSFFCVLNLTT